jgi:hypothetical protein
VRDGAVVGTAVGVIETDGSVRYALMSDELGALDRQSGRASRSSTRIARSW